MEKVTTRCLHFTMSLVLYKQKLSMTQQLTTQADILTWAREHSPFGGRITVWLVSSLTRLEQTNEGNMILFVFSEAV